MLLAIFSNVFFNMFFKGSVLGTTLFLLFINDLHLFMKYCHSDFFADDATFNIYAKKFLIMIPIINIWK